jgi:hypothetical protein
MKFIRHGDLAPGICLSVVCVILFSLSTSPGIFTKRPKAIKILLYKELKEKLLIYATIGCFFLTLAQINTTMFWLG